MLSLRSRAGDPAAQRWYSDCGDGTWRLRSLLQGTRVTYVTETFPFSRSLRVTSDDRRNWDPYQSATGAAPSSALCRPPDPSYKADDRTGLYTEKVNYCCSLSNPNSRTWVTLGSVPFRLEEAHCGVTSSQRGLSDILMWSNPIGPYAHGSLGDGLGCIIRDGRTWSARENTALISIPWNTHMGSQQGLSYGH